MDHHHPIMLFDEVARAAIPMTGTFKSQELANAVFTAFAKMDHHHPMLFDGVAKAAHSNDRYLQIARASDEVARASIPIIDTFDSQSLANLVSAIAKMRQDSESCPAVYSAVADRIKKRQRTVTAFTKPLTSYHVVGLNCPSVLRKDVPISPKPSRTTSLQLLAGKVFDLLFRSFLKQVDNSDGRQLESIADVHNAVLAGEHFNDVPSDFLAKLTQLAIEYSSQARMEDVRDILIGATRVDIRRDPLQLEMYTKYRPLFERYRKDMPPYFRDSINETYEYMGLS
eukprot:scaffold10174_cov74-Cylindrotheca_fusiformis.AAC.2